MSHQPEALAAFRDEIAGLSDAAIKRRYSGERQSHARILNEERATLCAVHPEFREFRSFLGHVGPKPHPTFTLDRINNADAEYGPGKVRWAAPVEQANNRGTTTTLRGPDGIERPLADWARITGQPAATMRQRKRRGWSDAEIIAGHRDAAERQRGALAVPEERAGDAYPEGLLSPLTGLEGVFGIRDEASDPWPEGMDGRKYDAAYRALADKFPNGTPPRGFTRRAFSSWALTIHQRRCRQAVVAAVPDYNDPEADPPSEETLLRLPAYRGMMQARRIYLDNGLGRLPLAERKVADGLIMHASAEFLRPAMIALGWIREPAKRTRRSDASAD